MTESELKFTIKTEKHFEGSWMFGINFQHYFDTTFLSINLFKISIEIGKIYVEKKD